MPPMWIVAGDKAPLADAEMCQDEWSHATALPRHHPSATLSVKTVVIVPLRRRRPIGVYYFESRAYIGITEVAKQELLRLGDSLAILFELYEAHKSQARMTAEAIDEVQEILAAARFPKLLQQREERFHCAVVRTRADPED